MLYFSLKLGYECGLIAHTQAIQHMATGVMIKGWVVDTLRKMSKHTQIYVHSLDKPDLKISLGDFYRGCLLTLFITYTTAILCLIWELRLSINDW